MYGMDENGRINNTASSESEDENQGEEPGPQTRFESKRRLKVFMGKVAKWGIRHIVRQLCQAAFVLCKLGSG